MYFKPPIFIIHNMKLLAIETATEACSAALHLDGECIYRYEYAPQKHAELILPMVDELLVEADIPLGDLDALSFGRGPGAFTGVRIATGVIQGLAFARDLPVVPVSTLAVLAQGIVNRASHIFSAIDARMGEVYWCAYEVKDNLVSAMTDEDVTRPDAIPEPPVHKYFGIGSGWQSYTEQLHKIVNGDVVAHEGNAYPHARDVIPLAINYFESGHAVAAEDALPVYLRNRVVGG